VGLAIAVGGYLASRAIPVAVPPAPTLAISANPLTETWRNIHFARENQTVFLSIMGISWFWLFGALFLAQFPAYTKNVLGGSETAVTLLLATFTFGIGVGSMAVRKALGQTCRTGPGAAGLDRHDGVRARPRLRLAGDAGRRTGRAGPVAARLDLARAGLTWR
jgi:hypothetical protein